MAVEGHINSKNSKTQSLRKLLDEEKEKVTLLWVPGQIKSCPGRRSLSHRKIPTTISDQLDQKRKTRKIRKMRSNGIKTRKR
jgi:hypothetical protein